MRILLSGVTGLGDFIFKTPLIYGLNKCTSELEIDILIGSNWGIDAILGGESDFKINYIKLPANRKFLPLCNFFKSIRTTYDYVIFPYDASDRNIRWSGLLFLKYKFLLVHFLPRYAALKGKLEALMLSSIAGKKIILVPVVKGRHEIEANLDFIKYVLDVPIEPSRRPRVAPLSADVSDLLPTSRYIVIQPNAANGSMNAKVWSPFNFDDLINKITQQYPELKIVLVGDKGDLGQLKDYKFLYYESVVNLIGMTSIGQLCEVLKGAELVVAHDSAITHITDAVNVPLIALYGPTDITKTGVIGKNSIMLRSQNDTFALMYQSKLTELEISNLFPPYYCMSAITVAMVYDQISNIFYSKMQNKVGLNK